MCMRRGSELVCGPFLGLTISCSGLAWWIAGIIWRFRSNGSFAVGDLPQDGYDETKWYDEVVLAEGSLYQHATGRFMLIFYLVSWGLMVLILIVNMIMALYMFIKAKKADEEA